MASGIYRIENSANNRCYIGSAVHLVNRWATHRRGLRKGEHCNRYLQRAWDKYGETAFSFVVLEEVADPSQLVAREQAHIDAAPGKLYNLAPRAGSNLGTKRTEESKARSSAAQKGRVLSEEHRSALVEAQKLWNAQNPEKRFERVALMHAGIDREKHREAVRVASGKRIWTDESRARLSASCMGRRLPDEAIACMAATKCKPVICTTTGEEFGSASEAALACGISVTAVSRICLGRYKQAHGFKFVYKEQ